MANDLTAQPDKVANNGSAPAVPPPGKTTEYIKREHIYIQPSMTSRYILIGLVALATCGIFAVRPVASRLMGVNRLGNQAGFWLPDEKDGLQKSLALRLDGATEVLITSTLVADKWLLDAAKRSREKGAKVFLILDGLDPYRQVNLSNRSFYRKNGFGLYLNTKRANLHIVLIDGKFGWMSTGPLNGAWQTTAGRVYQMSESECTAIRQVLLRRLQESDDGYKLPGGGE